MAKDPAFLFYPGDWLGGTMGMTFEEKGAYLELLMLQFNRGHMTKHMIGQTVGQLWINIKDKFIEDEKGLWYNERLEIEKNNRAKFTESRRNNIKGNNQYSKKEDKKGGHMTSHMENENDNENKNGIKKEEVLRIFLNQGGTKEMAEQFFNKHEAGGWIGSNGHPIKNFSPLVSNYIINWKNNEKRTSSNSAKLGTSDARIEALAKW